MGLDLVTRSPRCTRSTGGRAGSRASASRRATWSARCKRFTGLWEYNKTRELPRVQELRDWLADEHARVSRRRRSCTATTASATRWWPTTPPARVIAIFDWELSTIGDPLADVGYMTVTWIQPGDPEDTMFSSLSPVTRREGFPTRDEMIAHYEERTGRSMSALNWYQTLALWKAAVFMEGNYKRSLAGTTDDPYLKTVRRGRARARRGRIREPAGCQVEQRNGCRGCSSTTAAC